MLRNVWAIHIQIDLTLLLTEIIKYLCLFGANKI